MRTPRRIGFAGLRVKVAMVSASAPTGTPAVSPTARVATNKIQAFMPAALFMGLGACRLTADLAVVLLVGDVFEPSDMLAVESLLHRDMHHVRIGPGAMPMFLVGRDPDGVAG